MKKEINSIEELKLIELNIMKKIHQFCIENDITYYLAYGTLLGAVRHKGFIPWDDDIDLFMPRDDYMRFCKDFPHFAVEHSLELVNSHTDIFYGRAMSKVIDVRTFLVEPQYGGDDPIGVFVDIWPMDSMPDKWYLRKYFVFKHSILTKLFYGSILQWNYCNSLKRKIGWIIGRCFSSKKILEEIEYACMKCDFKDSKYVTCYVDAFIAQMEREWFREKILVPFEDAYFYIPVDFDNILQSRYGDYMKLPPENKRIPHHIMNVWWK